jgi:hypothetical protein
MMMYGVLTVTIVQCCACARLADAAASTELGCGMTWYHQQRYVVTCTVVHCLQTAVDELHIKQRD